MREKTIAVTVLWLSIKCYLSMYLALRDDIPRRSDLARSGSPQSIAYESCMSLFKENLLYVSNLITIFYYHHFGHCSSRWCERDAARQVVELVQNRFCEKHVETALRLHQRMTSQLVDEILIYKIEQYKILKEKAVV